MNKMDPLPCDTPLDTVDHMIEDMLHKNQVRHQKMQIELQMLQEYAKVVKVVQQIAKEKSLKEEVTQAMNFVDIVRCELTSNFKISYSAEYLETYQIKSDMALRKVLQIYYDHMYALYTENFQLNKLL